MTSYNTFKCEKGCKLFFKSRLFMVGDMGAVFPLKKKKIAYLNFFTKAYLIKSAKFQSKQFVFTLYPINFF